MRFGVIFPLPMLALVAACGSDNGTQSGSDHSLPLLTIDSVGDNWVQTTVLLDQGSGAVDPPCGTPPFSDFEVISSVVTEFENESEGLGLTEAVVQFSDDSHADDAVQAWRSLDCPMDQFTLTPLDLGSERRFGYELGFADNSEFAQAVIVTSLDDSLSVIVASGPAERAAEVALSAAG